MNYDTYHLPANYTDAGKLMGMFPVRNTIEALLLSAPIVYSSLVNLPFNITTRIIIMMVVAVPIGGFALIGINDDCLSRFLFTWWRWRMNRRILTFRGCPERRRGQ